MRDPHTPVADLRNLGPKSARMLDDIGVHSLSDLDEMGAVFAYRVLKHRFKDVTIVMLYALAATLKDLHWLDLTEEDKNRLRAECQDDLSISHK